MTTHYALKRRTSESRLSQIFRFLRRSRIAVPLALAGAGLVTAATSGSFLLRDTVATATEANIVGDVARSPQEIVFIVALVVSALSVLVAFGLAISHLD